MTTLNQRLCNIVIKYYIYIVQEISNSLREEIMKLPIVVLIILTFCLVGFGQKYKGELKDGWKILFYDEAQEKMVVVTAYNESNFIRKGGEVSFWLKQMPLPKNEKQAKSFLAVEKLPTHFDKIHKRMELYRAKCKDRQLTIIQQIQYFSDDTPTDSLKFDEEWENIPPDTKGDKIISTVCKKKQVNTKKKPIINGMLYEHK